MLTLLLALSAAQPLTRVPPEKSPIEQYVAPRFRWSRSDGRYEPGAAPGGDEVSYAFFEFAPLSGAGMTEPCACTTPTGAKGEPLTFTRTGAATCTKTAAGGLSTTGIADGDLVVCASNQPRVEYDSAGVLGLRVEGARTNSALRSEEFDNAVWTKGGAVVAAPVVTANAAVAPDGTMTADRVQFAACPVFGNQSILYQLNAAAGANIATVFLKSNTAGTQAVSVCEVRSASSAGSCTAYTLQPDSWTRAQAPAFTTSGASGLVFGCNRGSAYVGESNTGAADILAWGAMTEAGAYATSYIPTTSAAATRNAEAAYFDTTLAAAQPIKSVAANLQSGMTSYPSGGAVLVGPFSDANNRWNIFLNFSGSSSLSYFGIFAGVASGPLSVAGLAVSSSVKRSYGVLSPAVRVCNEANCSTTLATPASILAHRYIQVGSLPLLAATTPAEGIISRVCADPDPTRCR